MLKFFIRLFAFLALFAVHYPLLNAATTIRVGYPQLNGGQTPLWNIADSKLDQKYGLDVKPVYIPGGVRLTQAALSGSVDIAMTGGAAVNAMLSGAEFIYVGMPVATYAFSIYARPEIKEVTDLRGKVSRRHHQRRLHSDHAAIALLRQYKMTQQDMKVLYFSRQEDALAALNQGIVQAAVHSAPTTLMARRLGFKELVNIGSLKLPYPFMGLAVRRSAIQQSPDLIRGFLESDARRTDLKLSIEQPDVSKRAIGKYLASKDQEIIDEAYRSFAPLFPRSPLSSPTKRSAPRSQSPTTPRRPAPIRKIFTTTAFSRSWKARAS